MNRIATAANASLISNRSMSLTSRPALASALRLAGAGPVSMIVGSAPETAVAMIRARGVRPRSLPTCSLPMAIERGAVDDAGAVAGVVDVVDPLDPVVLLQRHGVEAGLVADAGEGRLQPGQALDGRLGLDELVVVEHGHAVDVLDRHDRAGEAAVGPGLRGAVVGLDGEGVDVLAGEALDGGDQVGADALRHERGARTRSPGRTPRRRRRCPWRRGSSTRRRRRGSGPRSRRGRGTLPG